MARRFLYAVALVLVPAFLYSLRSRWNDYAYPPGQLTWGESLLSLVFTALVAVALTPGSLVYSLFRLRPLRAIGRITYGIYVFHDIPHSLYRAGALRLAVHSRFFATHIGLGTAGVAVPCTLLLATLSFRFFEAPLLNLKERWAPSYCLATPPQPPATSAIPGG